MALDPHFPFLTWQPLISGTLTITVNGVAESCAISTGSDRAVVLTSGSSGVYATTAGVAGAVRAALILHSQVSATTAQVITTIGLPWIAWRMTSFSGWTSGPLVIEGPTATMRAIGLDGTPSAGVITQSWSLGSTVQSVSNHAGYFSPGSYGVAEPSSGYIATRTFGAVDASNVTTMVNSALETKWSCRWPQISERYVNEIFAARPVWADQAKTATTDLYNTIQGGITAQLSTGLARAVLYPDADTVTNHEVVLEFSRGLWDSELSAPRQSEARTREVLLRLESV